MSSRGTDSQRVIGGTLGTLTLLAPFGSGRVLSLFRTKLDTLTIQYRDGNGALHGVIFTMPPGDAEMIKEELIAQGAHTSITTQANQTKTASGGGAKTMKVNFRYAIVCSVSLALCFTGPTLRAKDNPQAKMKAAAIQVMMIQAGRITLPAEFQVSLYENLITQLQKRNVFQRVYRDGDQTSDASSESNRASMRCSKVRKGW